MILNLEPPHQVATKPNMDGQEGLSYTNAVTVIASLDFLAITIHPPCSPRGAGAVESGLMLFALFVDLYLSTHDGFST